jgi:MFS family permease
VLNVDRGCWVSDPLNELFFGRRPAIGVSACFVFAGAVGSALSERWYQLLACRAILGLGMGCKAAVVPVFAAEIAPAHLRGKSHGPSK